MEHSDAEREWHQLTEWAWTAGATALASLSGLLVWIWITGIDHQIERNRIAIESVRAYTYQNSERVAVLEAEVRQLKADRDKSDAEVARRCNKTHVC